MSNENLITQKNIKLNMSRRIRRTPFTNKVEECGVSDFTVVNHMLLPKGFKNTVEEDYWHLREQVQVWDVSCQRQVQITGPDAARLVQKMTPRSIKKMETGKCFYIPIIDETAGMINDPVLLKLDDDMFWISIADSDVLFFAKGLATGNNFDVKIVEPNVNIIAIQGPKSFNLMEKVFGKKILNLKFFGFEYFDFKGINHLIARSGWSKQGGFEVYVENTESGLNFYDYLFEVGEEFNVKPGCPNLIERIESGLLSYGNDFDNNDNPFECGFEKYVNLDSDITFLGKERLKEIKTNGISKRLMGIQIDKENISLSSSVEIKNENNEVIGDLRSACYSPHFKKVIGIAMIKEPNCKTSTKGTIKIDDKSYSVSVCELPFI